MKKNERNIEKDNNVVGVVPCHWKVHLFPTALPAIILLTYLFYPFLLKALLGKKGRIGS